MLPGDNLTLVLLACGVVCGVVAASGLHWLTNYLRLCHSRTLDVLGRLAFVLVGLFVLVLGQVADSYRMSFLFWVGPVALPVVVIALVAGLHRWQRGIPLGIAFSHLMAETFCAALVFCFVASWLQGQNYAGGSANAFALTLALVLLGLELLYSLEPLRLRRRAANRARRGASALHVRPHPI